ncbi:unnamed protein product [Spirodela intermedia]|uniref:Uncharacterized protein n=1 Tax=Spirodela intermedia TaxID=51605 RepID=A0A7I8IFB6_SPIIN|nr:unnamed protein product [Spirodela intermedia]CAA6656508.1 unnamed protein product [Spirodela intermedia]
MNFFCSFIGPVGDSGGMFMEFGEGPDRDEVFMEDGGFNGGAADGGHIQNMRRIEEWVRQIDIEDAGFVEELEERSSEPKERRDSTRPNPRGSSGGSIGGAEVAHRYISALAPSSTSAQMMNLGLVVIPFLGAFTSLRVLDLSGNAIVRMTSGALPRGLHVLNLSRNNISAIEGLRELTRLRVLDLSYNRILRIGHGLAGCSSLKELYLGGNKIGEVEGLHRLLKLSVLDLRGNKISTAKSLGQLAANYASLQAVNLDGNPAQRNVGEEQLRRHILGLLPRLVYFNRHAVRAVSSKDLADRAAAAALSDRGGVRSDHRRPTAAARRGATASSGPLKASAGRRGAGGGGAVGRRQRLRRSRMGDRRGSAACRGSAGGCSAACAHQSLRRIRSEGAL